MEKLVCIGGSNIDYIATSKDKLILNTSNIGDLFISSGGVMRNVVYNLALLGNKVEFISAIGKDINGERIIEELIKEGVILIRPSSNLPTSSYLAINDNLNNLFISICDNKIIEDINKDFLAGHLRWIKDRDMVVIDTNLKEEAIDFIFNELKDKKIIVEGVSSEKIVKIKPYLDKIYLLKANKEEIRYLLNLNENDDLKEALIKNKVNKAVISNGSKDTLVFENDKSSFVSPLKIEKEKIVNTNGCGDALLAGILHYLIKGKTLKECTEFGLYLSYLVIQEKTTYSLKIKNLK